LAVVILWQ